MTLVTYNFTGAEDASIVAGTAPTATPTGTGGSCTYDDAVGLPAGVAVGTKRAKCAAQDAGTKSLRCDFNAVNLTFGGDIILRSPGAFPGVAKVIATVRRSGGVIMQIQYNTDGTILCVPTGSIDYVSTVIPVNTDFRVMVRGVVDTISTGAYTAKVFTGSGLNTLSVPTLGPTPGVTAFTARNLGTVGANQIDAGWISSDTPGGTMWVAQVRTDDGRTTDMPAPSAPSAPTITAVVDDSLPVAGQTITLNSTGSTNLASWLWECTKKPRKASNPAIATSTASSTTVPIVTPGRYTFRLSGSNSGGTAGTPATVEVYAHAVTNGDVDAYVLFAATTWTNEGGAVDLLTGISDANAATTAQSPPGPTSGQKLQLIMDPFGPGPIFIDASPYYLSTVETVRMDVLTEDGLTQLATDTWTLPTVLTPHPISVPRTLIPNLIDVRALRVDIYKS
jgi:hypothetical protein